MESNWHSAICKIAINQVTHQTGWFVSGSGDLLTAGHGFLGAMEGSQYEITLHSGEVVSARLEHHNFDIGRGIDYALMKVCDPLTQVTSIPLAAKCPPSHRKVEVFSSGYRQSIGDFESHLEGHFVAPNKKSGRVVTLQIQAKSEDLAGFSGAPILVKSGDGYRAIGIQSAQLKQAEQHIFAVPISVVLDDCPRISRLIQRDKQKSVDFLKERSTAFPRLKTKQAFNARAAFTIAIIDDNQRYNELHTKIKARLDKISNEIDSLRNIHGWPSEKIVPSIKSNLTALGSTQENISDLFNSRRFAHPPNEYMYFIDFECEVDPKPRASSPLSLNTVTVSKANSGMYTLGEDGSYKLHVTAPSATTDDDIEELVCNIVVDSVLDATVQMSAPVLRGIQKTGSGAKTLNTLKSKYIALNKLEPYGLSLQTQIPEAISLASCCRPSLTAAIDMQKFRRLWTDFHNSLTLTQPASLPLALGSDGFNKLIDRAEDLGFSDQLSTRKLKQELEALKLKENAPTLCMWAIATKKPKGSKTRTELATALRSSGKYHSNLWCFSTSPSRMRQIMSYREFVEVQFFFLSKG